MLIIKTATLLGWLFFMIYTDEYFLGSLPLSTPSFFDYIKFANGFSFRKNVLSI